MVFLLTLRYVIKARNGHVEVANGAPTNQSEAARAARAAKAAEQRTTRGVCPACDDPDRLLACLWPCGVHGCSPCTPRPDEEESVEDPGAADPLSAHGLAVPLRRTSRFVEPSEVPVNHEFGLREGRHTLFAPPPPGVFTGPLRPLASPRSLGSSCGASSASGAGEWSLVERPARLPVEATLFFTPGQLDINVGVYGVDIAAEDLSMVWLVVDWASNYFRCAWRRDGA